jgi:hypothetical protein
LALHRTLVGWVVLELGLRVRERVQGKGGAARWLALTVCVGLPLPALLRRIHVEETELVTEAGR